jgi:DNA-binding response OmpR family regulator
VAEERTSPCILVADDDEDILQLVAMILEGEGYEVIQARDGEEAVRLAMAHGPDLCLLDVMMPKLDGCEVTRQLRTQVGTQNTPILLLSARTQWESVVKGREAGADEYITKPFVAEDLERSVRSLLYERHEEEDAEETPSEVLELLQEANGNGTTATQQVAAQPSDPKKWRVLVAASDENVVNLIAYRLQLGGYEAAVAYDSEQALQRVMERTPNFCVMDDSIPTIEGIPVATIGTPLDLHELYEQIEHILRPASAQQARSA